MKTVEEIQAAIAAAVPGAGVEVVPNPGPSGQHSLLLMPETAVRVAEFLRDDVELELNFLSNVTGVDWPEKEVAEKVKVTRPVTKTVEGVEQTVEERVEETRKRVEPGYLEVVYHLFSMTKKHGPVVLRMRTQNRTDKVALPSLTPVWRAAEFQEREVFDLYGVVFEGHPDLRRILMWDGFKDHPMRRDYVDPDDFEYEPTAHDEVLARAKTHRAAQECVATTPEQAGPEAAGQKSAGQVAAGQEGAAQ
ncbi:MAG: NADH-quinone oxidoreductase subunit C [Terracidiphilus sp.]